MNDWPAMVTLSNRRPALVRLPPPQLVKRKDIAQAIQRYEAALAAKREAEEKLGELDLSGREAAREADVSANAQAIRDKKPAPGAQHYAELQETIAAQRLQVESHDRVVDDAFDELQGLVENNRELWREEITTAIGKANDDYGANVNAVDQSLDEIDALYGLLRFANTFPEGKGFAIWRRHVEGLAPPEFPPTPRDRVIAALRELAAPAGPPLAEQQWPTTGASVG